MPYNIIGYCSLPANYLFPVFDILQVVRKGGIIRILEAIIVVIWVYNRLSSFILVYL
jgi:hypothetical protein